MVCREGLRDRIRRAKVMEEDGETFLVQIEDEKEFNEIGNIFEDRLIEKYEAEDSIKE